MSVLSLAVVSGLVCSLCFIKIKSDRMFEEAVIDMKRIAIEALTKANSIRIDKDE